MKYLSLALALSIGSLQIACSDDSNDDVAVQPQTGAGVPAPVLLPTAPAALVGKFATNCLKSGVLDLTSSSRQIEFSGSDGFEKKETYFLGDDCGDASSLVYRSKGTFSGVTSSGTSLQTVDFKISDAFLSVTSESLLITFNTSGFCGKTDWVLGQERSIVGLTCDGFSVTQGEVVPDVFTLEDGTLYFGESFALFLANDGSRPDGVNRDVGYTSTTSLQP